MMSIQIENSQMVRSRHWKADKIGISTSQEQNMKHKELDRLSTILMVEFKMSLAEIAISF
jgi:hypothetical protein